MACPDPAWSEYRGVIPLYFTRRQARLSVELREILWSKATPEQYELMSELEDTRRAWADKLRAMDLLPQS